MKRKKDLVDVIEWNGGAYHRIYYSRGKPTDLFEWIGDDERVVEFSWVVPLTWLFSSG